MTILSNIVRAWVWCEVNLWKLAGGAFVVFALLTAVCFAVGCSAPQQGDGEPVAVVDWSVLHDRLATVDRHLLEHAANLPEGDTKDEINRVRLDYLKPAMLAAHSLAMGLPTSVDPGALAWQAIDMVEREVLPRLKGDQRERAANRVLYLKLALEASGIRRPARAEVTP